ncbi:MAG: hypothetical protein LBC83_02160 [Oscillospiraceae bacterium]|nr:hypothetical protein [Oscillospiraceae bacterium]
MTFPQAVFLYGEAQDITLTLPLCRTLAALGGVQYFGHGIAASYGFAGVAGMRFVLLESESLRCCGVENAVVICKQGVVLPGTIGYADRLYAVCSAPPPPHLPESVEWVGCACGKDATLALSSLREDSAVAELCRPLPLPGGGNREPGEFPLRHGVPPEGYPMLCCAALELLFGVC